MLFVDIDVVLDWLGTVTFLSAAGLWVGGVRERKKEEGDDSRSMMDRDDHIVASDVQRRELGFSELSIAVGSATEGAAC